MITPRLQKIIDLVHSENIADVGTDHAYIPIRLAALGKIKKAVATDKNKGPLDIARANIEKYGFSDIIETRIGEGLEPLRADDADTVIIAGMGGKLIADIITEDLEKAKAFRLIIQPMNAQAELRKVLIKNGFRITKEELSREGFKVYNVFLCEEGAQELPERVRLHIPKELEGHPLYQMLTDKKIREFKKIIKGLENAKNPNCELIGEHKKLLAEFEKIKEGIK